jgi:hypothetical protein
MRFIGSKPDSAALLKNARHPAENEAEDFLRELLVLGSRPKEEIEQEAKKAGIRVRTLQRAKEKLGARSVRRGYFPGVWHWELPQTVDGQVSIGSKKGGHLRENVATFDKKAKMATTKETRSVRNALKMATTPKIATTPKMAIIISKMTTTIHNWLPSIE